MFKYVCNLFCVTRWRAVCSSVDSSLLLFALEFGILSWLFDCYYCCCHRHHRRPTANVSAIPRIHLTLRALYKIVKIYPNQFAKIKKILTCTIDVIVGQVNGDAARKLKNVTPLIFVDNFVL